MNNDELTVWQIIWCSILFVLIFTGFMAIFGPVIKKMDRLNPPVGEYDFNDYR